MRNFKEQQDHQRGRTRFFAVAVTVLLLLTCLVAVCAQQKRRRSVTTAERRSSSASSNVISVKSGGNLQAALNAAQPGDTIVLEAGATFVGSFRLPVKNGDAYITVRSSAPDASLPAAGVRVTPEYAPMMPKLATPGAGAPALSTQLGAHHYRFIAIEFKPVDAAALVHDLLSLGDGTAAQSSVDKVAHHLSFDRCYIHGTATGDLKRGIALNSAATEIINSYVADFHVHGQEAQAIMGYNGPGPFRISNNYLEAAGENVMFGGSDPAIANLVPSDIEISNNQLRKPVEWRGVWTVKNLLELKNARRVKITGNVMENCWADEQGGTAVLLTVRNQDGGAPWSAVQDIEISNNIVRHAGGGIGILGQDYTHPSQTTRHVVIANNVFEDISESWGGRGQWVMLTGTGAEDVQVRHNTAVSTGTGVGCEDGTQVTGLQISDNIFHLHMLTSGSAGVEALNLCTVNKTWTFAGNVVVGLTGHWLEPGIYPGNNFYPLSFDAVGFSDAGKGDFRLNPNSGLRLHAANKSLPGADFSALNKAGAYRAVLIAPQSQSNKK